MFCFQCQETAKNQGCTINGICGKKGSTANLQDLLIYKGLPSLRKKQKLPGLMSRRLTVNLLQKGYLRLLQMLILMMKTL